MQAQDIRLTSSLELLRWVGWAQAQAGQEWMQARELSRQQAFTLGYLEQNPGSIQRDIAAISRTTPASVSSLLQGLEARGLIERRSQDGDDRSKRVYATPAGIQLISGFDVAMAEAEQVILAPLDQAERDTFHALLLKITSVLPQPTRP
jgi:DNA-binding MarR family transcriptional regulator